MAFKQRPLVTVCAVRVIAESDIMQEFLSTTEEEHVGSVSETHLKRKRSNSAKSKSKSKWKSLPRASPEVPLSLR